MALYLIDYNALFLHVPKTGGSFVARTIRRELGLKCRIVGYKHSHKDLVGPIRFRRRPYTFAFVRHPLPWYQSYWKMKMRRPINGNPWYYEQAKSILWHPNWDIDPACGSNDFATWVKNVSSKDNYLHGVYQAYTGLGTHDEIDFIGKQETLGDDLAHVLDTIGARYSRDRLEEAQPFNRASDPFVADYTPDLEALVLEAERRTLLDYGYDGRGPKPGPEGKPALRSAGERIVMQVNKREWDKKAERGPLRRVVRAVVSEESRVKLYRVRRRLGLARRPPRR